MAEPGPFENLVATVGQALLGLRAGLTSSANFGALTLKLGWDLDVIPRPVGDVGAALDRLHDDLESMLGAGELAVGGSVGSGGAQVDVSAGVTVRVLASVRGVFDAIRAIENAPASEFPAPVAEAGFAAEFPKQLVTYLIVTHLRRYHPGIAAGLGALGVITSRYVPGAGLRPPHIRVDLDVAVLLRAVTDPAAGVAAAFGWGADFDHVAFLRQIGNLLSALDAQVFGEELPDATTLAVRGAGADPTVGPITALAATVLQRVNQGTAIRGQLRLVDLPTTGGTQAGLVLMPSFDGVPGFAYPLTPDITVTIDSTVALTDGVGLQLRPGGPIEAVTGFASGGPGRRSDVAFTVRVQRAMGGAAPTVIIGDPAGTRLQVAGIDGAGGLRLIGDQPDLFVEIGLRGLEFVLDAAAADGFVAAILPEGGLRFGADLTLGLSYLDGFYLRGTSNAVLEIPVHAQLGGVEVHTLTIAIAPDGDALGLEVGATFEAGLGPVRAVVYRMGVRGSLAFRPNGGGSLGPLDATVGFLPPRGVGLTVDAGLVTGGGFLGLDPESGDYVGALELELAGSLTVAAVGVIGTRSADGSSGFSMLVVLSAEFGGGGIPLGFGFTLLAVGGLVGLNRGMDLNALAEGVRTGRVDSLMFPDDVVTNAPRVVRDLAEFFPPADGTFLVGPMVKIGWGSPSLITASVGVIVEIPGDVAVVGTLRSVLPTADLALLVLQAAFVGALEFDKQRAWFVAELFDSRILSMTIDGGMAVLVAWGAEPELVVTVGGFHPAYVPPPLPFAVPRRLSVDILRRKGARITVAGYFAITSNTVQFGAAAEMELGFDDFGVRGHLGFDALFRISPFSFVIEATAGFSVRVFGIGLYGVDLRLRLEGPAPWRVKGRGEISLLVIDIPVHFHFSWGEERDTALPAVDVLPLLIEELSRIQAWETRLPPDARVPLVTLRPLDDSDRLLLHPRGTLVVHQRSIPLGVSLDRIGAQRPRDGRWFTVEPAAGTGLIRQSVTADRFAMAQFQDMDDAAKLSRPAFEQQDAGIELTATEGGLIAVSAAVRAARYESIVIDRAAGTTALRRRGRVRALSGSTGSRRRLVEVGPGVFDTMVAGSSTGRSPLSRRTAAQQQPFAAHDRVRPSTGRFVIAHTRNNGQAFAPIGASSSASTFRNGTVAADALADWLGAVPELTGLLHVVPESEAAASLVTPGTWKPVGPLPTPVDRGDTGAAVVAGGVVLVAGGSDAHGDPVPDTALFDPVTGRWTPTAGLSVARQGHTLTRLPDGRALAAGGRTAVPDIGSALELFDPTTVRWSAVPTNGVSARRDHTATLLGDGSVLLAGGTAARGTDGTTLATAVLVDPLAGTAVDTGSMTDARSRHVAVILPNGRVLVIGGALTVGAAAVPLAFCEIYDPGTGSWTPTGSMSLPRVGHQATVLADGGVLVTGGESQPGDTLDSAERYDPGTGRWAPAARMPGARTRHRAARLRSGRVLVLGGTGGSRRLSGYRNASIYDPVADTWARTGALDLGRADACIAVLGDGRVLAAGGTAGPGPVADAAPVLTTGTAIFTP